jgi:hypothetical protein
MPRSGVRPALLALLAGLAVLVAGCTKPVPGVTIAANGQSLRSEATQYVQDGKLRTNDAGAKVLTVRTGDVVNISVDKATKEAGWAVRVGDTAFPVIEDKFHFSFTVPPFSGTNEVPLAVFQAPPNGGPAAGSWVFTLRQDL